MEFTDKGCGWVEFERGNSEQQWVSTTSLLFSHLTVVENSNTF